MIAPLVAGIVNPLVMPLMTVLLVVVLWLFDRPAHLLVEAAAAAESTADSEHRIERVS